MVKRCLHPSAVEPGGMALIAACGLAFNCVIAFTLHRNTENLTVKSVFLHFMGDALSDFGVLLGGIIIRCTGFYGIDTVLSAGLACLILYNAVKMTAECVRILLEGVPPEVSIRDLSRDLTEVKSVLSVTDVHVWSLSRENLAMTAHVCSKNPDVESCERILHMIQHLLNEKYEIEHSTIQFERTHAAAAITASPTIKGTAGCASTTAPILAA